MQAQSLCENREETQAQLAQHLLPLPGSAEWALWRCAALRGAGFPAARVLRLTATAAAAAADELLAAETEAEQAREAALDAIRAQLNTTPRAQSATDESAHAPLVKALRKLKQGKLSAPLEYAGPVAETIEAHRRAHLRADAARATYEQTFKTALAELSQVIRQMAEDERFREAVTWQNRHALHGSIDALLRMPAAIRDAERRRREELVVNYVQRYCVKNDTIGFFGPVGWARLDEREEGLSARPGQSFLAQRGVYFEGWGLDALLTKLNRNRELCAWMAPRRLPLVRVEGTTLYHPLMGGQQISAAQAAVLRLCDGSRTAEELARHLIGLPFSGLKAEAQVYGLLEAMRSQGVILWEFEVPFELYPEQTLRRQLNRIADDRLRRAALAPLDVLEAARARLAQANGDLAQLEEAFVHLESTFTRLTDEAATRSAGKTLAARTLVYEDCRRDVEVVVGRQVLEQLAPPLQLLLTASRWLTVKLAATYRQAFKQIYARLVRQTGSATVDALQFWVQAQPLIFNDNAGLAAHLIGEFQARWAKILSIPPGQRQVNYRSDDLRQQVAEAFAASGPGWNFARHHSPDVMIAAKSLADIQRGDFQLVMGELHVGKNTLGASLFVSQHPAADELMRGIELDLPTAKAVPMSPKEWLTSRINVVLISPQDHRIEFERESFVPDRSKALAIADLVVEERGGELIVRTRDHRLAFNIIEALADALSNLVVDHFKLLRPQGHTPRVTIDKLIIAREAWHFPPPALAWAHLTEEAARFLAARRWAQQHALPTRVFVKVPVEAKPCYVDFSSPVLVNVLAKLVRRTVASAAEGMVQVTEMKPEVEEVWLADGAGAQYTAELRLVALDLTGKPAT